eukprot:SAG22_NODE_8129_length_680_cov_1.332186_1_plen_97_part_00
MVRNSERKLCRRTVRWLNEKACGSLTALAQKPGIAVPFLTRAQGLASVAGTTRTRPAESLATFGRERSHRASPSACMSPGDWQVPHLTATGTGWHR